MTIANTPANTQKILEQRALQLARHLAEEVDQSQSLHLITFALGDARYGIEINWVQEVQPLRQTYAPVPCTPGFIVGAVNIRGRIFSITDVAQFFGLPGRPVSERAHVLLVRAPADMELCLLADSLPQAETVLKSQLNRPTTMLSARAREYTLGVTPQMLVVLNLAALLADPALVINDDFQS